MPPKTKTDEPVAKPPRPTHLSELCSQCGLYPVHPDYAAWSCEHGTWDLTKFADPAPVADPAPAPSDDEVRAAVLDSLSAEELQALLDAKTAPPKA